MMKATYICDRCGKEVPNVTYYTESGYAIMRRDPRGIGYIYDDRVELCPKCQKALDDFMNFSGKDDTSKTQEKTIPTEGKKKGWFRRRDTNQYAITKGDE